MLNGLGSSHFFLTDTRGKKRIDDRRVPSGIVHALKNGGRWTDCPRETYGPKKTLYNRFVRWAERGHLRRDIQRAVRCRGRPDGLFINSTCITRFIAARMACVVLALPCNTCPIKHPVMMDQCNRSHQLPGLNT